MHIPLENHYKMFKRILRYVQGTFDMGIQLHSHTKLNLYVFVDVVWAGCPTIHRSTTGFCTFLGRNCISWCAKKKNMVSHSSTEVEYCSMTHIVAELTWITSILRDLRVQLDSPPTIFCDNLSALYMTVNPIFHARSKHIEIDYHYVRERVALGLL